MQSRVVGDYHKSIFNKKYCETVKWYWSTFWKKSKLYPNRGFPIVNGCSFVMGNRLVYSFSKMSINAISPFRNIFCWKLIWDDPQVFYFAFLWPEWRETVSVIRNNREPPIDPPWCRFSNNRPHIQQSVANQLSPCQAVVSAEISDYITCFFAITYPKY